MSPFTREDLDALLAESRTPCVSLYLPTVRAGPQTRQNPIRLGNLVARAEEELADKKERKVLEPVRALVGDAAFWRGAGDGLALFAAPGGLRRYRTPIPFEERVCVGDRFCITPLLPLLEAHRRFYVLALSQKRVRLVEATRHAGRELDLHDVPNDVRDVVGYDHEQKSLQFHTGAPGHGGGRDAMFHGQGEGAGEEEKAELVRFFRAVDAGIVSLLRDDDAPLVLAAVDYLVPLYADVSSHPRLLEKGVEGNPEEASADELARRAWPLVEPVLGANRRRAAERFDRGVGAELASDALEEVVVAAHDGRVDTLLLREGARVWGRFDPEARRVERRERPGDDAIDLVEEAAHLTLRRGGRVEVVEAEEMPGGESPVAAIFRHG